MRSDFSCCNWPEVRAYRARYSLWLVSGGSVLQLRILLAFYQDFPQDPKSTQAFSLASLGTQGILAAHTRVVAATSGFSRSLLDSIACFFFGFRHHEQRKNCVEAPKNSQGLCIPQDDAEKKSQCIYGLASFLNKSDDLIVLWSPRYFSRLWCTPLACSNAEYLRQSALLHCVPGVSLGFRQIRCLRQV